MSIEAVNDTFFPVFLFIVFFSSACCFLYNPASSLDIETSSPLIQQQQLVVESKQLIPEAVTINTQLITLRQARSIASAIKKANSSLGIQQKVNGSDASVEWLRIQIKNRLEQAPELVIPIISELAPAASSSQPKSTKVSRDNTHNRKVS
ncbi:hypothetical protein ACE1CI_19420 [Aerosakkonemataceae cyanobacterium BLCC-F50]|uniref:Uncharacterized protein n=1 Tax=Floridaenema flaviceps BLCC-F50 TaxID=3153642 RepID=A0ABV4XVH5_9CYAN